MKNLKNVIVITIDNDAEGRQIMLILLAAGIAHIRSAQPHGASLEKEHGIQELVLASGKTEVWTVEIPGPAMENLFRRNGLTLTIIDHHTYGQLDRAHDTFGKRKLGSLEQFLLLAGITDKDLRKWKFDPRLVHGIGVMDDRFVRGLRTEGFSPEEVRRVIAYREMLDRQINPEYDLIASVAENVWQTRRLEQGYLICTSTSDLRVSYAVCTRSITDSLEEHPLILVDRGGRQIYVSNVPYTIIKKLEEAFEGHRTFTYALGRCWGIDNDAVNIPKITLEEILSVVTRV